MSIQYRQCTYKCNIETRARNHFCHGKAINIMYSERERERERESGLSYPAYKAHAQSSVVCGLSWAIIQSGTRNVIPFYHPIKIVTSQYRCCKRASECCSSWKMR